MRQPADRFPLEVAGHSVGRRGRGVELDNEERIQLLALVQLGYGIRPLARAMKLSPTTVISVQRKARPGERRRAGWLATRIQKVLVQRERQFAVAASVATMQGELWSGAATTDTLGAMARNLVRLSRSRS